ncbi:alpha/beta fold hydrolase [Enterococcus thailandicus]|uniref:alpha/beta fold hydrolase n=1 Tax=Enterococcus TaxID=1350 RepID=UPI0032E49F55
MNPIMMKRNVKAIPVLEVVLEELKQTKIPVVIYYHGWQTSKELVLTQGRKIAQYGIRVILPDAMNHGERKQPVSSIPSYTFWNSIYGNLFEFDTLIEHLDKRGLLHEKVAVGGVSMGGMTTCALLSQHPKLIAGACLMGSPAPLAYGQGIQARAKEFGFRLPKDYFELISWVERYDLSLSPERLAGRPLFFWHGKEDEKIPFKQTADFVKANQWTKAGRQIIFHPSEKEGHLVEIPLMEEAAEFFYKCLIKENHEGKM